MLLVRHHRRLSLPLLQFARHVHSLDLTPPTFIIYASNTSVGKTLVSAGIADAAISSSSASSFLYLKPLQTGFPLDSDSRFVFRKVSDLFRRRSSPSSAAALFASNHVISASVSAREEILGLGFGDEREGEERGICLYEEIRVGGEENDNEKGKVRLDCKTIFGWKAAISPHLAAEKEGMRVDDSTLREMVAKSLGNWLEEEDGSGGRKEGAWRLLETAGGVASPGPSGTLQCDLYR